MAYRLIVTERAEELIDSLVYHLLFQLKSEQAAIHLINEIEKVYTRLEDNPFQFPLCRDKHLASRGYHEAIVSHMNYIIIFDIIGEVVNILGIFHQLEHYQKKVQ